MKYFAVWVALSFASLIAIADDNCMSMYIIEQVPAGYLDENDQPTGVHWQYLERIEQRSGICMNKQIVPYARVWKSFESGQLDGSIIFRSPDREEIVAGVSLVRPINVIVAARKGIEIHDYDDLAGLTIAKTRGTQLNPRFDADTSLNIIEVDDYEQAAKMFKAGYVDAVAGGAILMMYQLMQYNGAETINLSGTFKLGIREQWFLLSQSSQFLHQIPALKQAVEDLKSEGVLDEILTAHYGDFWRVINP